MKKRLVLSFIFAILCFVGISADNNTNENCEKVSMVAYEQRWIDSKATIALRNNTDEEVTSVSFTLEYLDMNDNPRAWSLGSGTKGGGVGEQGTREQAVRQSCPRGGGGGVETQQGERQREKES